MAFTNRNVSRSFSESIDASSWTELNANTSNKGAGGLGQECTEVIVTNHNASGSVGGVYILDRWDAGGTDNQFFVPEDTVVTFNGLTNCNNLSAKSTSGSTTVFYRTSFYSGQVLTG
jgi:hypothetical protein